MYQDINDNSEIARRVEPPKSLPTPESFEAKEVSFFATTNTSSGLGDDRKVFGVLRDDRRRHMYVIGKTGVGKTRLLEHLIRSDIYYGHGVCVVDPNGDLVADLLNFIPKERRDDVVLIDPTDASRPLAWNPLSNVPKSERHHVVSGVVEVFSRLFGTAWNPRAEHLLRFALLALMEHPKASFTSLLSMLSNEQFRSEVVLPLEDGIVKRFWMSEFPNWKGASDKKAMSTLVNSLTGFLSHPNLYAVFSGTENKINLGECIRDRKIVLVTIPKGVLGDQNSTIFGSLFLALFKTAALSRAQSSADKRDNYYLYVDEFQNVATESFLSLLSESGRYGICVTASNQYLGQLSTPLRNNILGNVATLVVFQVSAEDAVILEKEFAPIVETRDMINLPVKDFYIKLSIKGRRFDPFSATTLALSEAKWPSERDAILGTCREKYCRPKA